jgi:hypothetical protein
MAPRDNVTNTNYSDILFKVMMSITGFALVYMLNEKSAAMEKQSLAIEKLNNKIDLFFEQRAADKTETALLKSKQIELITEIADLRKRVTELELDKARRGK